MIGKRSRQTVDAAGKKLNFWVEQGNDACEAPHHSRRGYPRTSHPNPHLGRTEDNGYRSIEIRRTRDSRVQVIEAGTPTHPSSLALR